ncbi:MAG: hypothetical protein AB2L20_14880 [Mangrovibacterium sp.]
MSSLHFESTYDDSKLKSGLRQSNRDVSEWAKNAAHSGESVEQMFKRVQQAAAGYFTLQFAKSMITQIASVRGEWQKYEAVLTNTLGSNKDAVESLKMISEYGAKTNFQVNELTDSFVKLAGQGFKPTRDEMAKLGDLAASKAKGFNQLTEAIIDAETFEFERLKEFGISASKDGEKITFTFKGIKTTIDASAESVRNYVLSLGELEGVKGSTEAISKTIVGLASNFQDALDQMFNSMGKSQEGLIAGSIKAGTELVQNYEKVIDVLKVLVATYGAYKAVTIASAAASASAHFADNIRLISMFRKELGLATAAQQAFNISAKANPYGLILAGITAVVSALLIFSKGTKTAEDMVNDLNDSIAQIGKQQEINTLIEKYDELKDKTKLTDNEQKELNSTIQQLATIFPDAARGVDQYGNAIDLVREKLVEANKEHLKYIKNTTTAQIAENQVKLNQLIKDRTKLESEVNTGKGVREIIDPSGFTPTKYEPFTLTGADITKWREQIVGLDKDITSLQEGVMKGKQTLSEIGNISAEQALKPYQDLFKKVSEYTTKQAYDTKAKLTELLGAGLGSEAEEKIKQQIDSIAESLNLPTVKEQIAQITKAIADAEVKLTEMRAPGSLSSAKEITEQEKNIKDQKDQLAALTGVKQKEIDKQLKSEEDRLKKQAELNQAEIDMMLTQRDAILSLIDDGYEKQKALAKQAYDEKLIQLDKEEKDYLDKLNDSKDLKVTDKGYITSLSSYVSKTPEDTTTASYLQSINDLRLTYDRAYVNEADRLNEERNSKERESMNEYLKEFGTYQEKRLGITQLYADKIAKAQTQAERMSLGKERDKELQELDAAMVEKTDLWVRLFDDAEKHTTKYIDQTIQQTQQLVDYLKGVDGVEIPIGFTKEQIDSLKKDPEKVKAILDALIKQRDKLNDRNPFRNIISGFKDLKKAAKGSNEELEATEKIIQGFKGVADVIGQVGDALDGAGSKAGKVLGDISTIVGDTASMAQTGAAIGGPLGAAIGGAIGLGTSLIKVFGGAKELSESTIEAYGAYMDAIDDLIKKQQELIDSTAGTNAALAADEARRLIEVQIEATRQMGEDYFNSGSGWFSSSHGTKQTKIIKDYASELRKLGIEVSNWDKRGTELFSLPVEQIVKIKEELPKLWAQLDESTRSYLQSIIEGSDQLKEITDSLNESLTGVTFDSAKNSMIDMLLDVDTTAEDVAGNLEDYFMKAIVKIATSGDIEEALQGWHDMFADAMKDNTLSSDEKKQLQDLYNSIYADAANMRDTAMDAAGIDLSGAKTASGLTRSAQSLTEETGGELAGIWRKTSDDTRQIRDYTKEGINHLVRIEANTYNTVVELQNAVDRLDQVVTNTKPSSTSRDLGA